MDQTNETTRADELTKPKGERPPRRYQRKPDAWVPVDVVREHVLELMALGMTQANIARASGVSPTRIAIAVERKQTRFAKKTADALLSVKHEITYADDERHLVDPTRRRIGALTRIGWPITAIAEEAGSTQNALDSVMNHKYRRSVSAAQALGVQIAYEKLSQTPGPRDHTRLLARAQGWPPPQAWEDDELDDPEPTIINRVKARWAKMDRPTPGEALYDLIEANDYTHEEVAELIGVSVAAITKWVSDRSLPRGSYVKRMKELFKVDELPVATASTGPRPGSPARGGKPKAVQSADEDLDSELA